MTETIFRNQGFWWPAYERSPEKAFTEVQRGVRAALAVLPYVKQKRLVVQAGGHVGLVPMALAPQFGMVITYEAQKVLYDCMIKNLKVTTLTNVHPVYGALGDLNGVGVQLRAHRNSGVWRVDDNGTVPVEQTSIDSLELKVCDAIILDVEGYEPKVLRGAAQTIKRCRPTIQCEMLPRSTNSILYYMNEIGYRIAFAGRDSVFVPI